MKQEKRIEKKNRKQKAATKVVKKMGKDRKPEPKASFCKDCKHYTRPVCSFHDQFTPRKGTCDNFE